jgi:hypothetical protein
MTINPNPTANVLTIPVMAGGIPLNINISTGISNPEPFKEKVKKKPVKKAKYGFEVTGTNRDGTKVSTLHRDFEFPLALEEFEKNTLLNGTLWVSKYLQDGYLSERTMLRRTGPKYFNVSVE